MAMVYEANEVMLKSVIGYEGEKLYIRYTFQTPELKKTGGYTAGCTVLRRPEGAMDTEGDLVDIMTAVKHINHLAPDTTVIIDWIKELRG